MAQPDWIDVGAADELAKRELQPIVARRTRIALSFRDGEFGAISGVCNHAGGPLGEGTLDGDYVVCPWHYWKFHRRTGEGEPGFEEDRVPRYEVKVENGRVLRRPRRRRPSAHASRTRRIRSRGRRCARPGPIRVARHLDHGDGSPTHPRYSHLRRAARDRARSRRQTRGCETRAHPPERAQRSAHCEGYYSKSAHACTWPCSITQMDPNDQLDRVYEALVHWADVDPRRDADPLGRRELRSTTRWSSG